MHSWYLNVALVELAPTTYGMKNRTAETQLKASGSHKEQGYRLGHEHGGRGDTRVTGEEVTRG